VHSQSGDPRAAISFSDHSRQLSPFDPLLFAMLGTRAMSLARLGQYDEAAEWAMKSAARPNAHQHIMTIAACTLGLAGRMDDAKVYKARIAERVPDYSMADFLAAFRMSPDTEDLFKKGRQTHRHQVETHDSRTRTRALRSRRAHHGSHARPKT
jgi:hypothetical protein